MAAALSILRSRLSENATHVDVALEKKLRNALDEILKTIQNAVTGSGSFLEKAQISEMETGGQARCTAFDRLCTYNTSYQIAADYDAMLRWLGQGGLRLTYLPRVLVKMRTGGASIGSLAPIVQKSREDYRALRANRVGGMGTLMRKNAGKLGQFWPREKP